MLRPSSTAALANLEVGCVQSVACECGWERCYVLPEESTKKYVDLLLHYVDVHGLKLPNTTVTTH